MTENVPSSAKSTATDFLLLSENNRTHTCIHLDYKNQIRRLYQRGLRDLVLIKTEMASYALHFISLVSTTTKYISL